MKRIIIITILSIFILGCSWGKINESYQILPQIINHTYIKMDNGLKLRIKEISNDIFEVFNYSNIISICLWMQ
jgi:hypothetical protein